MNWQDSDEEIKIDPPNETAFQEEDYSPLGPRKRPVGKIFQMPEWPYRWIVAGIVVIVVVLVFLFSGSDTTDASRRIIALEKRVIDLENRIAALDQQGTGSPALDVKKIQQSLERFDRFEASTNQRMDQLTKRLESLSKSIAKQAPPAAKATSQSAKTTEPKTRYHLVSKGETLYSISRTYGMRLDELRRLNNLDEKAAIYPGQKLKIK